MSGLQTTFHVLTQSDNEAVLPVLLSALGSAQRSIREGALAAILRRRSRTGVPEVIRRLDQFNECEQRIVLENPGRLTGTLRDAVLGTDIQFCRCGCRAAVWAREYDLIPTLLTAIEDTSHANAEVARETMMSLVSALYGELAASPGDSSPRRDPQMMRRCVIGALEMSIRRFARHKSRSVIEAFLILVNFKNAVLKGILKDPYHAAFLVVNDVLSHSEHGGIIRLLLGSLDDPQSLSAIMAVIANRADVRFVQLLLHKIGREPSAAVVQNLKRIESIGWLRNNMSLVDELDDAAQVGAVQMAMRSGVPRSQVFALIAHLLRQGTTGGRREAALALAEFQGADANRLALRALDDPDPHVQAAIVVQLRRRSIPGALLRAVELVDSRHAAVRKAARQALSEFTFARFLNAFDLLDEEVRRSTAKLVRKIDRQTAPLLKQELDSPARGRRLRALAITRVMELAPRFEPTIIDRLDDEDHMVRAEAVAALAACTSRASLTALEMAAQDRSPVVQETARHALQQRLTVAPWPPVHQAPSLDPPQPVC